ncbi:MAG: BatA domain-containing protein [Bacteroidota bacterium]
MQFLHPFFLFGMFAVAVPVVIHLFNFRKYKKVFFSNVQLLNQVKQQTRKHSQLLHLIVLAMRILAIAALVLAFAQPYLPYSKQTTHPQAVNYVSIYVDNSFSMQAEGTNGTLIDQAKTKALEIAAGYKPSDYFQLITNNFDPRHQPFVSRSQFAEFVRTIDVSPYARTIPQVALRQNQSFRTHSQAARVAYYISDFQKNTTLAGNLIPDTTLQYNFVPITTNTHSNLLIDTCWFTSPVHLPGQKAQLQVRIKNLGNTPAEKVPLQLMVNNVQKAVSSFNIGPNTTTDINITYTDMQTGIHQCLLQIVDNPIIWDDQLYFSYNIQKSIPLLCISGGQPSPYINALLGRDSAFVLHNVSVNAVDYSAFSTYNLIILNALDAISTGLAQELQKFVNTGGSLLVVPSAQIDALSYREFLSTLGSNYYGKLITSTQKISLINLQNPIFNGVFESIPTNIDLPQVMQYYTLSRITQTNQDFLLKLQNGDIFLNQQSVGSGKVYLITVPLQTQFSNFPKHAVFVPTFYNMALLSSPQQKLYYIIGKDAIITLATPNDSSGETVYKLRQLNGSEEIIPQQRKIGAQLSLMFQNQIENNGNYLLMNNKIQQTCLSFNYNRRESEINAYTPTQINTFIEKNKLQNARIIPSTSKPITQMIAEMNQGKKLWKTFVLLALCFLGAEVLLLRLWK